MPPGDTATVTDPRGQITGLTDGVEYMVRIAAVNSLGLTPAAYADHWTHQHQPSTRTHNRVPLTGTPPGTAARRSPATDGKWRDRLAYGLDELEGWSE